jgi:anti-anti-sigma regulatory factor
MKIDVAKDFNKRPAGRTENEGKFTGEHFRKKLLTSMMQLAISNKETLIVDFSGTTMMGSSFLEESFGGLIRIDKLAKNDVIKYLKIVHTRPTLSETIIKYINNA